jgi:hypothetical protein
MVLSSSCDGVFFKIQKEKRAELQLTSTDRMSQVSTPKISLDSTLKVCFKM